MIKKIQIVIAHYGLNRKITEAECIQALEQNDTTNIFIDFEAGNADLGELYNLPFENIALAQQRKFVEVVEPLLKQYPDAHIAYFGLVPIPIGFHFGYLIGNTRKFTVYQWHHQKKIWFHDSEPPTENYNFSFCPIQFPQDEQKGKGNVVVRISTSFKVDQQGTNDVVVNPENEFDIALTEPNIDSLYNQQKINDVVDKFQEVLNCYANKLKGREQIHLFISASAGLPFALGTRVNTNIYPYIQTYQYDRRQIPQHKEAVLITKEITEKVNLTEDDQAAAGEVRKKWNKQLQHKIKPFIKMIQAADPKDWLQTVCASKEEYDSSVKHFHNPWSSIINVCATTLKDDSIDLDKTDVDGGFEYVDKTNSWSLDDGFLSGLQKRLAKDINTDIMQAGRLFFFHEALHYCKDGHSFNQDIASGIGQFPKVIEEADYQADAWALLNEYRYCCTYEPEKLEKGLKQFFSNAINTAVETMWSFVDTGVELSTIQIRSMNRFLNWYWQAIQIEGLAGTGTFEEIIDILFNKPVIEIAGLPIELRGHRTFFKLNSSTSRPELSAFVKNKIHRFAPVSIDDIVTGFKMLKGEKVKNGLRSFYLTIQ